MAGQQPLQSRHQGVIQGGWLSSQASVNLVHPTCMKAVSFKLAKLRLRLLNSVFNQSLLSPVWGPGTERVGEIADWSLDLLVGWTVSQNRHTALLCPVQAAQGTS